MSLNFDGRQIRKPSTSITKKAAWSTDTTVNSTLNDTFESQRSKDSTKLKCEDTDHFKVLEKIMNFFEILAIVIGYEVKYDYQPWRCPPWYATILIVIFSWVCVFNTVAVHIHNDAIVTALEPLAIFGVLTSSTLKTYFYQNRRYFTLSLVFSLRPVIKKNIRGDRADIILVHITKLHVLLKVYGFLFIAILSLYCISPIKEYIVNNALTSLLPLEILFVDQSTLFGYAIANIIMAIMGIYASCGVVVYSSSFIYCISTYGMMIELIGQDFKDLDEMWSCEEFTPYKRAYLRNICVKCQDLENFMTNIKTIYDLKIFVFICANYLSQIICLFEITKNDWTPGYGIAIGLFVEMMFYCYTGSQIPIANERMVDIICETNWHTYDLESQRIILLLLHQCQNFTELHLGPIGPLNLVVGVEIVKSIISYYIVLKELL